MSLQDTTVLDNTINRLSEHAYKFFEVTAELWIKVVVKKRQPPKALLKKIKKLAEEISETCEELP